MILSDRAIKSLLDSGKIMVNPDVQEKDIRAVGIRLHLGHELLISGPNQTIDLENPEEINYERVKIPKEGFLLKPGMFVLGSTHEKFMLPKNIIGKLDGRSTVARIGLLIHCSSDTIDGNHDEPRSVVLEMKNIGTFNIILREEMPVAMLVLNQLTDDIQQKSQSQYRNQESAEPPNVNYPPLKWRASGTS